LVERSRIVLLAAAGNLEIASALGITPKKAARWRTRFLKKGLPGLAQDAPEPFIWTASANDILGQVKRARAALLRGQSA
jgi:hypothetical protein